MSHTMTKDRSSEIHTSEGIIRSSDCQKLRGIKIDSKLHFYHVKKLRENCEH